LPSNNLNSDYDSNFYDSDIEDSNLAKIKSQRLDYFKCREESFFKLHSSNMESTKNVENKNNKNSEKTFPDYSCLDKITVSNSSGEFKPI
jgi:hypothetical protein